MTPRIEAPPDRLRYLLELQRKAARIKHGITRYYDDPVGFAHDCIDWGDGEGLTEYQEEVLDGIPRRKRVAVRGPHGLGKALELSVRIPTPSGWSTIGELRVGDEVFDERGKPCQVTAKSPVWMGDTYEVEFADGSVITAHGEHEWNAVDVYHRPKSPKPDRRTVPVADWRDHWAATRRVTTAYMAGHLRSAGGQLRWRIPTARPLELPSVSLPVDPYILGYWLGDGKSATANITVHESDWPSLKERIEEAGYHHGAPLPHKARPATFAVSVSTQPVRRGGAQRDTLALRLRQLGVLGNKHIPMVYKRASVAQRIELVRGLMDADGYRQAGGCDEVSLSCKPLALDVAEVLRSLGLAVRFRESDSKLYGRVVGRRCRIAARFDFNPYHLKRYAWTPRAVQASRHTQRTIVDIRKVADRPTQCIEVDSPSHLYLAGDSMIPTHNSGIAAIAVHWFALTRDAAGVDWKIPATAGSWHQLTQYLFPEIHKWAGRLRWDMVRDGRPYSRAHELQNLNLRLAHGSAFAGASANAALIEGAHADSLLFLFDEGKAIPAPTFDACEGALGGTGEAFALVLSTPGAPSGRFYDICVRRAGYEDWHPVHVTLERAMAAGRISGEWAAQRAKQWGEQSAIYQNRVLGEFFASDEDSVIPLAWAEAAVARWHAWDEAGRPDPGRPRVVGVDVAYTGQDRTVLAVRKGPVITELRRSVKEDTMQTTGRVKAILDGDDSYTAVVDAIGIGAGVVDRLREQGAKVLAFNASKASKAKDSTREFGFSGRRSEAWWTMRQALDPSGSPDICLPDDEMLLGDLSAPHWTVTSSGRIQVESKDEIRKRLGRSTDDGDACFVAGTLIETEHGPVPIEQVRPGLRVWTRYGLQPVLAAAMTSPAAAVMRVELQDGRTLTGTPNHPVWDGNGFRRLDAFVQDDRMWTCEPSGSRTAESSSRATRIAPGASTASTSGQASPSATRASARCTLRSTRPRSAPSLTAGTSTTRTRTRSTTAQVTWRPFPPASTPPSTSPLTAAGARSTWRTWTGCAHSPRNGTVPPKGARGTLSTAGRAGSAAWLSMLALALAAASPSRARWGRARTVVTGAAVPAGRGPLSGKSVTGATPSAPSAEPISSSGPGRRGLRLAPVAVARRYAAGESPVWNLTVAARPEYFANGILVHNCIQAFVPHLGDSSPGTVRQWAGAQNLGDMGVSGETRAHKRMREIQGRAAEGLEDAPWDLDGLDGFAPADDRETVRRGNVRSWR